MSTYQNILKFEYEHTKWGPYLTCRWNRLPLLKKWLIDRQVCYVCRFRLSNSTGCNCVTGTSWSRVGGFLSLFHPPGQPAHLKKNPPHLPSPVTGWLALFFDVKRPWLVTISSPIWHTIVDTSFNNISFIPIYYSCPQRIVNLNFWIFTDLFRVLEINKMQHFDRCNALKIIQRILFFGGINRFTFSNERARALTLSLPVARFGFSGVQTNPDTASTRVCLLDIILGRRRDREILTFF